MSDERKPTVFNDRYELHRKLARGGMSDVYLARDLLLDRPVAVKVLFPEYAKDPAFVERFRREAKAAANLNHPNIVAVYDWGAQYNTYFIVMEYVEGRSLSEIIRGDGAETPERAAEVTADIASALAFAHRNGVVHRDIKPGNIMITTTGQVKVADFGIAQALASEQAQANLTQAGAVMGTATYFSPEQAQGKPVDPRSDLYSLGCVLFEMLTARPPFTGDTPVAIAYKHVQEPCPLPTSLDPSIPAELEAIDLRLLAKDPDDRYATADDLRTDLRRFIAGQPVEASGAGGATAIAGAAVVGAAAGALAADATRAVPSTGAGAAVPPAAAGPPTGEQPAYASGPPPNKRSSIYIGLLIVLLVLLAGVLVFLGTRLSASTEQVVVPTVKDQPKDTATKTLEDAGFKVEVVEEANAAVTPGNVIDQTPDGGTKTDKGSIVTIRVSKGTAEVEVPDLIGKSQAAAESLLRSKEFIPDVKKEQSDKPAGEVIDQTPAGLAMAPKGSIVTLVVSDGPASLPVPNVAGKSVSEASKILTDAGFVVAQSSGSSPSVPVGNVISTNPPIGSSQPKGTTITMVVSTGPAPTTTTSASTTTSTSTTSTTSTSTTTTVMP